jgi:hypothetical protein
VWARLRAAEQTHSAHVSTLHATHTAALAAAHDVQAQRHTAAMAKAEAEVAALVKLAQQHAAELVQAEEAITGHAHARKQVKDAHRELQAKVRYTMDD